MMERSPRSKTRRRRFAWLLAASTSCIILVCCRNHEPTPTQTPVTTAKAASSRTSPQGHNKFHKIWSTKVSDSPQSVAISDNGTVLATFASLNHSYPYSDIVAYSGGRELWRAEQIARPFLHEGAVISHDGEDLVALSSTSGALLWKHPAPQATGQLLPSLRGGLVVGFDGSVADLDLSACARSGPGCLSTWPSRLDDTPNFFDPRLITNAAGDTICAGHEDITMATRDGRTSRIKLDPLLQVMTYFVAASTDSCAVVIRDQTTGANNLVQFSAGCSPKSVWKPGIDQDECLTHLFTLPTDTRVWPSRTTDSWIIDGLSESLQQQGTTNAALSHVRHRPEDRI